MSNVVESVYIQPCRCACGYKCGGPGICKLDMFVCLQQKSGHFERDCDHDWTGTVWDSEDGQCSSVTCVKCGTPQIFHDMRVGP
jgi:hypothetical protein